LKIEKFIYIKVIIKGEIKMSKLEKDIAVGLNILAGYDYFPEDYNFVYLSTNEAISRYYNFASLEGKNVLTVASSGDHILQAVCNGADSIDTFDKNRFQIYFAKLKLAAVKTLQFSEFIDYFNALGDAFLQKSTYMKIRDVLEDDIRAFWDGMYYRGRIELFYKFLFNYYRFVDDGAGSYRLSDAYEKTKNKLDSVQINFCHADLHSYMRNPDNNMEYDAIFLSNIYDHLSLIKKIGFYQFVHKEIDGHLTDDGMAFVYAPVANKNVEMSQYVSSKFKPGKVYVYRKNDKKG